jgi:hypothetical protein
MSGGPSCQNPKDHRSNWRVVARHSQQSAFGGYQKRWSPYSEIVCLSCLARWRTKAKYVKTLSNETNEERAERLGSGQ